MQFFIKCPEGQKDEWAVIEMQVWTLTCSAFKLLNIM